MKKQLCKAMLLLILSCALLGTDGCHNLTETAPERTKIRIEFDDSTSIYNYIIELRNIFPEYEFDIQAVLRRGDSGEIEERKRSETLLSQASIHEDVADIVISGSFYKELPNLTEAFAELSGEWYTSEIQTSYLNQTSIDGKLYYLPFFIGLKGIVYNQTLFEENGWQIPQNYQEFTKLLSIVSETGISPISVRNMTDFGAGLFSISYLINDGATLEGFRWLKEFSLGNPVAEQKIFENTLNYMKMLNDSGQVANAPEVANTQIAHLMKFRKAAMCITNSEGISRIYDNGTHDQFAMMPLYSEMFPEGVIIEHNMLYIGIGRNTEKDTEKAEAINKIMTYIYSEKGQLHLLDKCRGLVSPCYGMMSDISSPSLEEFKRVLESGNLVEEISTFAVDQSFDKAVLSFINGEDTEEAKDGLLRSLNEARAKWLEEAKEEQEILTYAEATFSRAQLLELALKAIMEQTESDAVVAPALSQADYYGRLRDTQLFGSKLYKGAVTEIMLEAAMLRDFKLNIFEITGAQLLKLIDCNITNNVCMGIIPELTFDKEKKTYLTTGAYLPSGEKLNPDAVYRVCIPENVSTGYPIAEEFPRTLTEVLISYCASQESVTPADLPEPKYIR